MGLPPDSHHKENSHTVSSRLNVYCIKLLDVFGLALGMITKWRSQSALAQWHCGSRPVPREVAARTQPTEPPSSLSTRSLAGAVFDPQSRALPAGVVRSLRLFSGKAAWSRASFSTSAVTGGLDASWLNYDRGVMSGHALWVTSLGSEESPFGQ